MHLRDIYIVNTFYPSSSFLDKLSLLFNITFILVFQINQSEYLSGRNGLNLTCDDQWNTSGGFRQEVNWVRCIYICHPYNTRCRKKPQNLYNFLFSVSY